MTKEEYSRIISTVRRLHDTWFQTEQYRSSSSAVISLPKLSERDLLIEKIESDVEVEEEYEDD